jgi:hypothetical protein
VKDVLIMSTVDDLTNNQKLLLSRVGRTTRKKGRLYARDEGPSWIDIADGLMGATNSRVARSPTVMYTHRMVSQPRQ